MKEQLIRWLSTGLLLGSIGCGETSDEDEPTLPGMPAPVKPIDSNGSPSTGKPGPMANPPAAQPEPTAPVGKPGQPVVPVSTVLASLSAVADCTDLLTRIQDDAIAKLKMQVLLFKKRPPTPQTMPGGIVTGIRGGADAGTAAVPPQATASPEAPGLGAPRPGESVSSSNDAVSGGGSKASGSGPTSASNTNTQVADVDEADFVKVVENGKGIFLLHGNTLRKLKSWPAAETALVGKPLELEGSPNEMFVTDEGKAVVFSTVYGYASSGSGGGTKPIRGDIACGPEFGGCGGYGYGTLKITVADVSAEPTLERQLYYEGNYVSSRRYDAPESDVVRAVLQAGTKYSGLYAPDIEWYDAWGRPYDAADIASQLDEWEKRTTASIRKTKLSDWIPTGKEVVGDKLVDIAPDCDSYFVPEAGLSDYGLTHVLSLDVAKANQPVGGVTILGAASTVYSNSTQLVLAQPDYRWAGMGDFGIMNEQSTALHVFDLAGANTTYKASGWVFGSLPPRNTQFGIDVAADGTVRVATTGSVRDNPKAAPESMEFWAQHTENYVITARVTGKKLEPVGKSVRLGKEGETIQSARFVGDRGYVVTFRQVDPLYVLDVANALTPTVLGELSIPGFSEYMHPLDATHLVTFGQSGQRSSQLQLFDVTNPKQLPAPKTYDFGAASSSELSYNHKAFTLFEGVIALPVYNYGYDPRTGQTSYRSLLELIKVDATTGFAKLGAVDHARLYANNGLGVQCGYCDAMACYDYACSYAPELRRGHFVKGDNKTYVYSFSYAGVQVNDLAALAKPVATVGLPAPIFSDGRPWYGSDGLPVPVQDAGVPSNASAPSRPKPVATPRDAAVTVATDAGVGSMAAPSP